MANTNSSAFLVFDEFPLKFDLGPCLEALFLTFLFIRGMTKGAGLLLIEMRK